MESVKLSEVRDLYRQIDLSYSVTPEDCLFIIKTAEDFTIPAIIQSCENFKRFTVPALLSGDVIGNFKKAIN